MVNNYSSILKNKNIAVIGISDKPERASYQVARYLLHHGYKVIPINPNLEEVLGEKSFPSISSVPTSIEIDVVDIFRKPEAVIEVIKDVLKSKRQPIIWLQEGVSSLEAENFIKNNGFELVSGICMMKEHAKNS